jgi:DNA-binding NarL/FixJ family response regulator
MRRKQDKEIFLNTFFSNGKNLLLVRIIYKNEPVMMNNRASELSNDIVFSNYDWGDIAKKLTAFVILYLNTFVKKSYMEWNLPKGYMAQDVAYQAITDVLQGTRNWDNNKEPDLLKYLQFSVCRSILSNILSSAHNKATIQYGGCFDAEKEDGTNELINRSSDCSEIHDRMTIRAYIEGLIQELQGSKNNKDNHILLLMLEGHRTRDIADGLGISESEVCNAKKRIRRKAKLREGLL